MSNNQNQGASIEAAPCPFCGSEKLDIAIGMVERPSDYIMCNDKTGCGAMISREDTQDGNLLAAWNRRTPAATTGELPPPPAPEHWYYCCGETKPTDGYTLEQLYAYARAAIEADRAQQAGAAAHALWCAEVNLDGANEHIDELQQTIADLRAQLASERQAKEYEQRHAVESEKAVAQLQAQLAAKGQGEMSGDVLYAAWHKVGADVAGLRFSDFMRALAAPASAQPADDRQHMSHADMLALCAANPAAASGLPLGAQPDQRESAAAAVASSRTIINPDGSSSTFISEYESELENDLAAIRDLFQTPDHGELHNLWSKACSEPRAVVAYVKAQFEARAAASPAAQPAKDEQNNGWQKLDDDFRLQFGRLVDVVLTNGVYEYGRRCNQVDWTQVQDWRYADSANNSADKQKGGA